MPAMISKSLSWALDPIVIFVVLLVTTTIFASAKRLTLYLLLAISSLSVFAFSPVSELLLQSLENYAEEGGEISYKEYAVVLGGDNLHLLPKGKKYNYAESFDRIGETLRLYREKKISKIIVTGGDVEYAGNIVNEAKTMAAWLEAMGVSPADIIQENSSRSTRENAANVKEIIDAKKITDFYLITTASHMRRSLGVFRKLGMNPTPFAVDYRTLYRGSAGVQWKTLGLSRLGLLKTAFHEYAGIAYYSLLGYL